MRRLRVTLVASAVLAGVTALVSTCQDTERGSTIGVFGREARFPMYYTVAGANAAEGEIWRIASLEPGDKVTPELVASGLDFPTGVAVDTDGTIYFTEALPTPDGRVRKLPKGATTPVDVLTGLNYPLGVTIDGFGKVYVLEAGSKSVLKVGGDGAGQTFLDGETIGNPRAVTTDAHDNLLLVELGTNVLTKVSPKAARSILSPEVVNPSGVGIGPAGEVYLLVNNTSGEDGQILKVEDGQKTVDVADALINPLGMAVEGTGSIYVTEGDPANRVIRISLTTGTKSLIARTGTNPFGIAFTPF